MVSSPVTHGGLTPLALLVAQHDGHYYQIIGGSFASLTWMDAFHDATHRCHNGKTGYLTTIQVRCC